MPIIVVKTVKGIVLTSDEQKRELLQRMTDTFIDIVGEVARPYTYCLIEETPIYEWSLAGRPLPDLPFLSGPEYAEMHRKANDIMRAYIASQSGGGGGADATMASMTPAGGDDASSLAAQDQWAGGSS